MENKKRQNGIAPILSCQVGMTRFELATPRPPDVCATGLRYIPKFVNSVANVKAFLAAPACGLHNFLDTINNEVYSGRFLGRTEDWERRILVG